METTPELEKFNKNLDKIETCMFQFDVLGFFNIDRDDLDSGEDSRKSEYYIEQFEKCLSLLIKTYELKRYSIENGIIYFSKNTTNKQKHTLQGIRTGFLFFEVGY